MDNELYQDISYSECVKIEKRIDKKTSWFNFESPSYRHFNETTEGNFNNSWENAAYWYKPTSFIENVDLELVDVDDDLFRLPIEVYLNEYLKDFIKQGELNDQCNSTEWAKVKESPKLQREKRQEIEQKIIKLQSQFDQYRNSLVVHFKEYIKANTKDVEQYEKFYFGNDDGRNTFKRNELIGEIETAYRGIMTGSIYAYEWLIHQYVKPGTDLIDNMREITDKILELTKDYLIVQYLQLTYQSPAGRKKTPEIDHERIKRCVRESIKDEAFIHQNGANKDKPNRSKIANEIIRKGLHINKNNPNDRVDKRTIDRWIEEEIAKIDL